VGFIVPPFSFFLGCYHVLFLYFFDNTSHPYLRNISSFADGGKVHLRAGLKLCSGKRQAVRKTLTIRHLPVALTPQATTISSIYLLGRNVHLLCFIIRQTSTAQCTRTWNYHVLRSFKY
jgi:hypothetical protein